MMMNNNIALVNPTNYYEDNYPCKISINCQHTISVVFLILSGISFVGSFIFHYIHFLVVCFLLHFIFYFLNI